MKKKIKYDDSGKVIEELGTFLFGLGFISKKTFEYNDKNQLVSERDWHDKKTIKSEKLYEFIGAEGFLKVEKSFNLLGNLTNEKKFHSDGKIAEALTYGVNAAGEKYEEKTISNYDDNQNLTQEIFFWNGVQSGRYFYKYDSNKILRKSTRNLITLGGRKVRRIKKYDSLGAVVSDLHFEMKDTFDINLEE